jgi:hypothetical protein
MGLPFIKAHKMPRIAKPGEDKLPEEKIINGSDDDMLNDHVATELMNAFTTGDKSQMMAALEVVIRNVMDKMNEPTQTEE